VPLRGCDLDRGVGVAPEEGQSSEPVFLLDGLADAGKFFRRQNAGGGGRFRAGDFPPDGAGTDLDLGVVANALALS